MTSNDMAIAVLSAILLAYAGAVTLLIASSLPLEEDVPLVKADPRPYKRKPDAQVPAHPLIILPVPLSKEYP